MLVWHNVMFSGSRFVEYNLTLTLTYKTAVVNHAFHTV